MFVYAKKGKHKTGQRAKGNQMSIVDRCSRTWNMRDQITAEYV